MSWLGLNKNTKQKCPRCDTENNVSEEYCSHCGIAMASPRPAILKGNRWEATHDELAVFFKGKDLKGLFSKTLYIPSGMRGYLLDVDRFDVLPEGEHSLETLPERINSLFSSRHVEVLIARQNAVPLPFAFDDVPCAEFLLFSLSMDIHVKIATEVESGNQQTGIAAFRNHFMTRPGVVTSEDISRLLSPSVRQLLMEFLSSQSIKTISADMQLREKISKVILHGLEDRLKDFGLAFDDVDNVKVSHRRYDENKQLMGELWLDCDEKQQHHEHQKKLNALYSEQEQEAIKQRRAKLDHARENATLTQDEQVLENLLRNGEVERLRNIVESKTKEEAINRGGADEIEKIKHEHLLKSNQRAHEALKDAYIKEDEETEWQRIREIASIQHQTQLKIQKYHQDQFEKIEKERIENQIKRIQIEGDIERAQLLDDEAARQAAIAQANAQKLQVQARENYLESLKNNLAAEEIQIQIDAKKGDASRIEALEDARLDHQIEEIKHKTAQLQSEQNSSKMEKLLALNAQYDSIKLEQDLKNKRELQKLEIEAAENALNRKLVEEKAKLEAKIQDQKHEKDVLDLISHFPIEALIARADNPAIASLLADLAKTKVLATASPEQIEAIGASRTAQTNPETTNNNLFQSAADSLTNTLKQFNEEHRQDLKDALTQTQRANEIAQENLVKITGHFATANNGDASGGVQGSKQHNDVPPSAQVNFANQASFGYSGFKNCLKCNAKNDISDKFCGNCAAPL